VRHGATLISIAIAMTALIGVMAGPAVAFTFSISSSSFGSSGISPSFSGVRSFEFEIDFSAPLVPGGVYDNSSISEVRYIVSGNLSTSPPTPSGFSAFFLNRTSTGEGAISAVEWIAQGSSVSFEVAESANLADGLQLSDLVPDLVGLIFELDAREFERLDRARYHPPQLLLYADGTGILRNSNNSSGSTGTLNPATMLPVDVDFGEEYITMLTFDSSQIGVSAPEPGSGLLLGFGLIGLVSQRKRARSSTTRTAPTSDS
jgi:hypothetical protein